MRIVSRQPSETPRRRMGDLACLPVFFTLKDRPVLVTGGSDAAAWKAELLAAAGARVTVCAPDGGGEDMRGLAGAGLVDITETSWEEADWTGMALAVGDCEEDEAQGFLDRGRREGVPVNVIDKPAFCQFQFGSIVNRSPLVIGISTNGAAPILGQAVRRRIETLLPATLAGWAHMAQAIRARVTDILAPGPERRAFWERFADLAFRADPDTHAPEGWIEAARSAPGGRVTLVGAGPGDAEYLTLKAVRALQSADVILSDDLVSDDVLELARREAKRILVGKRARRESCRQEDINALMIKLALQGKHVVRLKSGDPMIFGRAGEEIAELDAHDIPVSVVPGISAAFALAAELKVSLTHRDHAQSVRFVTGHARNGKLPANLDWAALSDPATSHVYYMSGATVAEIAERLLGHGMDPSTPVIVAANVSRPDQDALCCALSEVQGRISQFKTEGPLITCIGHAFTRRLRQSPAAVAEERRLPTGASKAG